MDYTIMKVFQTTQQGDIIYGISKGTNWSFMSLVSVTWTLFRSLVMWVKFDFNLLGKGGHLFKFIGKFRYRGVEDLPQELLVEKPCISVKFLETKTREITAGTYLIPIWEIVNGFQFIWPVFYLLSTIIF